MVPRPALIIRSSQHPLVQLVFGYLSLRWLKQKLGLSNKANLDLLVVVGLWSEVRRLRVRGKPKVASACDSVETAPFTSIVSLHFDNHLLALLRDFHHFDLLTRLYFLARHITTVNMSSDPANILESGLVKELNKLGRQRNSSATPNLNKAIPVSSPTTIPPLPTQPGSVTATRSVSAPLAPDKGAQPTHSTSRSTDTQAEMADHFRRRPDQVGGLTSPARSDGTSPPQVCLIFFGTGKLTTDIDVEDKSICDLSQHSPHESERSQSRKRESSRQISKCST